MTNRLPDDAEPGPATKAELRHEVAVWAERINVKPARVQVQAMKKRWGSCSPRGTLTLSAELLSKPAWFREVVIVHELLHLLVPNHGRVFKALLKAYLPNAHERAFEVCERQGHHRTQGPVALEAGLAGSRPQRCGNG